MARFKVPDDHEWMQTMSGSIIQVGLTRCRHCGAQITTAWEWENHHCLGRLVHEVNLRERDVRDGCCPECRGRVALHGERARGICPHCGFEISEELR